MKERTERIIVGSYISTVVFMLGYGAAVCWYESSAVATPPLKVIDVEANEKSEAILDYYVNRIAETDRKLREQNDATESWKKRSAEWQTRAERALTLGEKVQAQSELAEQIALRWQAVAEQLVPPSPPGECRNAMWYYARVKAEEKEVESEPTELSPEAIVRIVQSRQGGPAVDENGEYIPVAE